MLWGVRTFLRNTPKNCSLLRIFSAFSHYSCFRKVDYVVRGWKLVIKERHPASRGFWNAWHHAGARGLNGRIDYEVGLHSLVRYLCIDQSQQVWESVKTGRCTVGKAASFSSRMSVPLHFLLSKGGFGLSSIERLFISCAPTSHLLSHFLSLCEGEVQLYFWTSYLHRQQSHCALPGPSIYLYGKAKVVP